MKEKDNEIFIKDEKGEDKIYITESKNIKGDTIYLLMKESAFGISITPNKLIKYLNEIINKET